MHDNIMHSIAWVCIATVAISAIAALTYYNVTEPSQLEIKYEAAMKMVDEHGVNPMLIECMSRNWNIVSDFEICKAAVENPVIAGELGNEE